MVKLSKEISWIDTGTFESLLKASKFFHDLEKTSKIKFACVEEIAYNLGFIDKNKFKLLAKKMNNSEYGKYLKSKI